MNAPDWDRPVGKTRRKGGAGRSKIQERLRPTDHLEAVDL
jgi:hypothetical protein